MTAAKAVASCGVEGARATNASTRTPHPDYNWRSKVEFFVPVNTNTTPFSPLTPGQIASNEPAAYGLLKSMATLQFTGKQLRPWVWGRNLANQYFKAHPNSFYLQGDNTITPGDTRTLCMNVDYRF